MSDQTDMGWVGTWTTTPSPTEGTSLDGQTLRMIVHISIGGGTIRVRLSNAYGNQKLSIGGAHVALRSDHAEIIAESGRALTFNGQASTTIATGALVVSDPVDVELPALSDLAISIYLPDTLPDGFAITGHAGARQTNYISPKGDFTAATSLPIETTIETFLLVSGVDVLAPTHTGGIVALGDSLTDCNISEVDANNRWTDQLARRLVARSQGRPFGVMNQGIGGNRILHDAHGGNTLARFDRDVLAQTGVSHVIVFLGINDIRNRNRKPEEDVTAGQMIAGLSQIAVRAQTAGLKIFGGTILTFENENYNPPPDLPGFYTPERESIRQEINAWIREAGAFDAVLDFEAALRDPDHPTRMLPEYDCGDHLHPCDEGYLQMGDYIDLALFD